MKTVIRLVVAALLVGCTLHSLAQATMISALQFSVSGVTIGSDRASVLAAFGKPLHAKKQHNEYLAEETEDLDYQGLSVRLASGKVDKLLCSSASWATHDGIRVGDPLERVIATYGQGRLIEDASGKQMRYEVAAPRTDCQLILHLSAGKVTKIELWVDES